MEKFEEMLKQMGDYELIDVFKEVVAEMKKHGYNEHRLGKLVKEVYEQQPR